jgi:hypothetical protein
MTVEQLQIEIEALPESDFLRLRKWVIDTDWEKWDQQLEADVAAGKLDFLLDEAGSSRSGSALTTSMIG